MQPTNHLTLKPGVLIAWHTSEDYHATRSPDGTERLYVLGVEVPLTPRMHSATQFVINACREGLTARQLRLLLAQEAV